MHGGGIPMSPQSSFARSELQTPASTPDLVTAVALGLGWAALYVPTFWDLAHGIWSRDEQGHGPIILALSLWLLFQKLEAIRKSRHAPQPLFGWSLLTVALAAYAFGRSQSVILLEVGSQILLLAALLLIFKGMTALKVVWFPLFFLIFMIPLPSPLVAAVTGPLKSAVSAVAESALHEMGYPVARSGVMLVVGQYQLLVADACAGLNSMFTLEALGLLYLNLMRYTSAARNVALAVLIVPIAFSANVIRVMILVLVTYYFGDAAGQGVIHGMAGIILFSVALALILITDAGLGALFKLRQRKAAA